VFFGKIGGLGVFLKKNRRGVHWGGGAGGKEKGSAFKGGGKKAGGSVPDNNDGK